MDRKLEWIGGGFLVVLSIACAGDPAPVERAARRGGASGAGFAIRGARVFDGERTLPVATVLIQDGRIAAVGADLPVPDGMPVVDGEGKTLLPGLIDAHTHSFGDARRDALRFGVTTELDMFNDWHILAEAKKQRESLAPTDKADLWSAGTLATAAGGHGTQFGVPVATLERPDQATGWVDARLAEGSDYIKIVRDDFGVYGASRPTLDGPTVAALIAATHARKKLAVIHVAAQEPAREALMAGADGFVHVFQDAPADPAFVSLARQRGAFVVPTLSLIAGLAGVDSAGGSLRDARLAEWLSPAQREGITARFPLPGSARLHENAVESIRRLHRGGVKVLAGTDAPNPSTAHGATMHDELEQLVGAGLAPEQALAAATAWPAAAFRIADRGRIASGQRADLLLVQGDPTRDIRATRAIVGVWKNGHPVSARSPRPPRR